MSESADKYEEYNYEQDKYSGGHGGKHRSKKEAQQHHHTDGGGHTRKIVTNMQNSHEKDKQEALKSHGSPSTVGSKEGSKDKDTAQE